MPVVARSSLETNKSASFQLRRPRWCVTTSLEVRSRATKGVGVAEPVVFDAAGCLRPLLHPDVAPNLVGFHVIHRHVHHEPVEQRFALPAGEHQQPHDGVAVVAR